MRPLNAASYTMIEGFKGLAPDGLPGHRRVDHRLRATSEGREGEPLTADQAYRNAHSKRQTHQTASPGFTEI